MESIFNYFSQLQTRELVLWVAFLILLIAELAIHRHAAKKPPVI